MSHKVAKAEWINEAAKLRGSRILESILSQSLLSTPGMRALLSVFLLLPHVRPVISKIPIESIWSLEAPLQWRSSQYFILVVHLLQELLPNSFPIMIGISARKLRQLETLRQFRTTFASRKYPPTVNETSICQ